MLSKRKKKWNKNTISLILIGLPGCLYPVSYTHLDVYKRQEYDGFLVSRSENIGYSDLTFIDDFFKDASDRGNKNSGWISAQLNGKGYLMKYYVYGDICISALLSEDPVSYTHLDVYKRQLIICGSDRRGAMWGIYDFCEQFLQVDPLYLWT